MIPVFKFVSKYYFKSIVGPVARILFPLILLVIMGEISVISQYDKFNSDSIITITEETQIGSSLGAIISGIAASSTFMVAFSNFPTSIVVFRDSVILKRISAARITKFQFAFATLAFYFLVMIVTLFLTILWGGIILCTRMTNIANPWQHLLPKEFGATVGFYLLSVVVFLLFGLMLSSIFKKVTSLSRFTSFINFPTTILIGAIVPIERIESSDVLQAIRYIFLHTQPAVGFASYWRSGTMGETNMIVAIVSSFALIILFVGVIAKKFRWSE